MSETLDSVASRILSRFGLLGLSTVSVRFPYGFRTERSQSGVQLREKCLFWRRERDSNHSVGI